MLNTVERITIDEQDIIIIPLPEQRWGETRWQCCRRFLQDLLSECPIPAKQANEAARLAGFSPSIVRQTKERMGIESLYQGTPQDHGVWWWKLREDKQPEKEGYVPDTALLDKITAQIMRAS
jgi:hypothetical protein